jgi:hypothetical protein
MAKAWKYVLVAIVVAGWITAVGLLGFFNLRTADVKKSKFSATDLPDNFDGIIAEAKLTTLNILEFKYSLKFAFLPLGGLLKVFDGSDDINFDADPRLKLSRSVEM